ncbi:prostaglandin E2 receptor EP3 subtype-like [Lampetra fluviatilis]
MCDHAHAADAVDLHPSSSSSPNWSHTPPGAPHNATRTQGCDGGSRAGSGVVGGGSCVQVMYPALMMVAGVTGNAIALALIRRAYPRRQSARKRPFLILVGALVLTDLLGKLSTTPVVIAAYAGGSWHALDASGRLCDYFGFCMVAFGLCPLLFACAMALERNVAVRRPYAYKRWVTTRLAAAVAGTVWVAALVFSALPLLGVGRYVLQWPDTWCFLSTGAPGSLTAAAVPLAFSLTGLCSLLVTTACNASTLTFVVKSWIQHRRHQQQQQNQQHEKTQCGGQRCLGGPRSEAVLQLMGISAVLWACWGPLLVVMTAKLVSPPGGKDHSPHRCAKELLAVRLASLSQILDPWVYILLRRGALLRGGGTGSGGLSWRFKMCARGGRGDREGTPEARCPPAQEVPLRATPIQTEPGEGPGVASKDHVGSGCDEDEDEKELMTLPGRIL